MKEREKRERSEREDWIREWKEEKDWREGERENEMKKVTQETVDEEI